MTAVKEDPNRQANTVAASKPDFYVGPNGPESTLPTTAYRYMDSSYTEATKEKMSAPLSYFGFSKFSNASIARDKFQIFYEEGNPKSWSDAKLRGEFDTLQLYDENGVPKVKVLMEDGNTGSVPEPFTSFYPEYGSGGEQQVIPSERVLVKFKKVDVIPD